MAEQRITAPVVQMGDHHIVTKPNLFLGKKGPLGAASATCDCDKPVLYVVSVVSNPVRFKRRYQLFHEFCERMLRTPQVKLVTAELQQGDRAFATEADLKLRTTDELWAKENLMNLAVQQLPDNWQYVAFLDADIAFQREDWVQETLHRLQTYAIVQLFSQAVDLGPDGEAFQVHQGFMYQYLRGIKFSWTGKYGGFFHPGYGFAMTREAFNAIGGLIDWAILGSADSHMMLSFIGEVEQSCPPNVPKVYKEKLRTFQSRCERFIRRNVGYVPGTILHYFHGKKKDRKYRERWAIITENHFNPEKDIFKDWKGVYQLDPDRVKLRDEIRAYFRGRNEDSIDMD